MAEPLLPNPPLAGAYNDALASIGREPRGTDAVGGAWSRDSGCLSHVVPLIQPQVRLTGLEIATDPALVHRIREEFAERLLHDRDHTPRQP